jgi:CPA2 family monovalent cation:H+ antiporter-2
VVLGDITQQEVLEALGCRQAQLVVLGINDANATERATRTIRKAAPDLAIIARTPYEMDKDALRAAGATRVITAEATASDALVSTVLAALSAVRSESQEIRTK